MKNRAYTSVMVALLHAIPVTIGCGANSVDPNRPAVVKVSGTVSHKNQPVEGATVLFTPTDGGLGATGLTDIDGKFQLRTFDLNDGAVPGRYDITIFKYDMSTANPELEDDLESELMPDNGEPVGPTPLLPARYADASTSGLSQEVVTSGVNNFPFDLVD